MREREVKEAFDPFRRVLAIIDKLPATHLPDDATPLREALPGAWPSLGDLRRLAAALSKAGASSNE